MSASWQQAVDRQINSLGEQLIAIRRHLHQHPELSGQEHGTTQYLLRVLEGAGLAPRAGPDRRGVIVESDGGKTTQRIALRADIDALPIQEARDCSYRSRVPGVMHACGHDAHTATVLGAALTLSQLERTGQLPVAVSWRALFQPAEETLVGAKELVRGGALANVEAIFSLHVDPTRPVGTIGVRTGVLTANCDTLQITLTGRGGHAARPHQAIDPIAAAAQLIGMLYAQVPRRVDSQEAVVLSFGQLVAGEAANVIPDHALLRGTLRTLDGEVRRQAKEEIERIAWAVAEATGTKIELQWPGGIGAVVNDAGLTDLLRRAAGDVIGQENIQEIARPSMGSEDFASYLDHVPGSMFRLGCASTAVGHAGLHTPTFDVDERALILGARILVRAVILWSQE
jgi:amidohydrolase